MTPRSPLDLRTSDQAPYAMGVTLGTALAGAIILFVLAGTLWPLLGLIVLVGAATAWTAALRHPATDAAAGRERATPSRPSFRDWNSEAGATSELAVPAVAPIMGSATPAAKSTFVDTQA